MASENHCPPKTTVGLQLFFKQMMPLAIFVAEVLARQCKLAKSMNYAATQNLKTQDSTNYETWEGAPGFFTGFVPCQL